MSRTGEPRGGDAGPVDPALTHLDEAGRARMVDVAGKATTDRAAVARARLRMTTATATMLSAGRLPKGDALPVARVAGIMAAKRTPELIPLCHQVALTSVDVDVHVDAPGGLATVTASARAADRTGVEMEALTAVAVASLTLYDMVKAVERTVVVEWLGLLEKSGGARGDWQRVEGA
jgi:cyclic pyranopterin monophosphate synthase